MRWPLQGNNPTDPQIWHCAPLVVVHPADGVVYAQSTDVEFRPDDASCRTGQARALTPAPNGWCPEMRVSQRIDEMVEPSVSMRARGGATLFGDDEEGFSFAWYIDRAADRFITQGSGERESRVTSPLTPDQIRGLTELEIDASRGTPVDADPLVVVEEDGFTPFAGPTQICLTHLPMPRVDEHGITLTQGERGEYLEIFVTAREAVETGRGGTVLSGIDRAGRHVTWYLDGAADEMTEALP